MLSAGSWCEGAGMQKKISAFFSMPSIFFLLGRSNYKEATPSEHHVIALGGN
jgi:hypothetical protein